MLIRRQKKKKHHDESKLAVQTPPQELHSQHFKSDAVLDNSAEHLDEIEARSGPSAYSVVSQCTPARVQIQKGVGGFSGFPLSSRLPKHCQRRGVGGRSY